MLLQPKYEITEKDVAEIPQLAEHKKAIEIVKQQIPAATGRRKFLLKKQLIEMYKDQYVIKDGYRQPMQTKTTAAKPVSIDLYEHKWIGEDGLPHSDGLVSFFNPEHILAILCNYNGLKLQVAGKYQDDFFYLMEDFDKLLKNSLADYPIYQDIINNKIQGASNLDIQKIIQDKYKVKHSVEYISSLWRHKIPALIAEYAENEYLLWYYTYEAPEKAKWKTCTRCGQTKLAHNRFFSKNSTSRDGFYSICKQCRNSKRRGDK